MFREMRRKKQLLSAADTIAVLNRMTSGVLALLGDNDYPYAVRISYVYHENTLYFHSALAGHKVDAIAQNSKASFCVIEQDQIVPEEYTTYFRSAIAFGKISMVNDDVEKRTAIELLAEKYSPAQEEGRLKEIEKGFHHMCVIKLDIEHLTGKEAVELVRAGRQK